VTEDEIDFADGLAEDLALLRAADILAEPPVTTGRFVIMNDVWAWAHAGGEDLPDSEVRKVADLFRKYGWCGILYWASEKNGGLRSEFKDNNRFIDFVKEEEALVAQVPDSNKRAYLYKTYLLGAYGELQERYAKMPQTEWFKQAHEGRSLGTQNVGRSSNEV
jgi:hypothetical protein